MSLGGCLLRVCVENKRRMVLVMAAMMLLVAHPHRNRDACMCSPVLTRKIGVTNAPFLSRVLTPKLG